jgi:hypothetical protein
VSTILRRRRGSRMNLGPYKRHELLGGRIDYPVQGYDGYGDGRSVNVADYVSAAMKADWRANREQLMEFWRSGASPTVFPDSLPWLCTHIAAGSLPWAAQHLD